MSASHFSPTYVAKTVSGLSSEMLGDACFHSSLAFAALDPLDTKHTTNSSDTKRPLVGNKKKRVRNPSGH